MEEEELFSDIVGYDDVKERIWSNLKDGQRPVHFLFYGPPGTAKTLFLDALATLPGAKRMIGGGSTKVGTFEVLEEHAPFILIIDEIDKMKREDQGVLLALMESQRLVIHKHNKHIELDLPYTRVFAAANNPKRLTDALLSRFIRLYFRPYSESEFKQVVVRVLQKEGFDFSFAQSVAQRMWNAGITDVRQARQVARLAGTKDKVQETIDMVIKYR